MVYIQGIIRVSHMIDFVVIIDIKAIFNCRFDWYM